jgi:hypothetical protein
MQRMWHGGTRAPLTVQLGTDRLVRATGSAAGRSIVTARLDLRAPGRSLNQAEIHCRTILPASRTARGSGSVLTQHMDHVSEPARCDSSAVMPHPDGRACAQVWNNLSAGGVAGKVCPATVADSRATDSLAAREHGDVLAFELGQVPDVDDEAPTVAA